MIERKSFSKTPREQFMRAAEDELAKFVRKELAFQRAEREERALRLRMPIVSANRTATRDRLSEK